MRDNDFKSQINHNLKLLPKIGPKKEQNLKTEANTAVSTASKMSPNNSAGGGVPLLKRNALDLSPQELDKMLDEYYAK